MPGKGRVCGLAEVYDSKEFTGTFKSREEKPARVIYRISQNTRNHLHSLGVSHRKKRWREAGGGSEGSAFDMFLRDVRTTEAIEKSKRRAYRF